MRRNRCAAFSRCLRSSSEFSSSWPGLSRPSTKQKPVDPRVKPGDDGCRAMSLAKSEATQLTGLTLAEARDGLAAKQFSACELTDAYIAAMERARRLNAYITETPDVARDMAAEADARLSKGEARPLDGIPIAV